MLTTVTKGRDVRAAVKLLRAQIREAARSAVRHRIGYPGGDELADVWALHEHGFFWCELATGDPANRCWNGFGRKLPGSVPVLPLDVEFNVPWKGVNRRVAGVFVTDGAGVYLGHRGGIGGGRKGVGRSAFWARYRGLVRELETGERVALLGRVGSPRLLANLASFITHVAEIKASVVANGEPPEEHETELAFSPEPEGRYRRDGVDSLEVQCDHGTVVRQLRDQLWAKGWTVGNDRSRDLIARAAHRADAIFEVKTGCDTQSVFTAVGQLIVNGKPSATGRTAVLVVPSEFGADDETILAREGIRTVRYRWADDARIIFFGLDALP